MRADLFSAGMRLHLWLTGSPPLETDDLDGYLAWAWGADRGSLRRLRSGVPRVLGPVGRGRAALSAMLALDTAPETLGARMPLLRSWLSP